MAGRTATTDKTLNAGRWSVGCGPTWSRSGTPALQHSADFAVGSHLPFRQHSIASGRCAFEAKQSSGVNRTTATSILTVMSIARRILFDASTQFSKRGKDLKRCEPRASAIRQRPASAHFRAVSPFDARCRTNFRFGRCLTAFGMGFLLSLTLLQSWSAPGQGLCPAVSTSANGDAKRHRRDQGIPDA